MSRISKVYSKEEKKLIVVVIVLSLAIFSLCLSLSLIIIRNERELNREENVCLSKTCVRIANFLLSFSNSSDACGDFFPDMCSSWNQTRPSFIPNIEKTQLTIDKEIREMLETINKKSIQSKSSRNLLKFYHDCRVFEKLKEEHLSWLRMFLRDLGGWPLIEDQWDGRYYEWIDAVGRAANTAGIRLFVSVSTQPDELDSKRNILKLEKPELSINISSDEYFRAVKELAILSGASEDVFLHTYIEDIRMVNKIVDFPKSENLSEKLTLEELQNELSSIDWMKLVQVITNSTFNPNFSIKPNELIILKDKEYFVNLNLIMQNRNISKRILANYIGANSALTLLRWFYKPLHLQEFFLDQPIRKNDYGSISSFYCIQFLRNTMNFALDHLLAIYQHFKLNQGEQMNEYLITVMKHIVSKMKNLSLANKEEIILKLDDLIILNNAPDWIFKQNFIDNMYYQLPELNSHILDTTSKILTNSLKSNFKNLREVNLRNNWPSTISITDHKIVYNAHHNSLIIPAFLTHSPLFKSSYPNFMNFASIGTIVGRELIQKVLKISSNKFLSEENSIIMNGMIKDFIKEHNTLDMLNPSCHYPEITNESSGITLAYLAYKQWEHDHGQEKILPGINYSTEQLFFIFHGLTWCSS